MSEIKFVSVQNPSMGTLKANEDGSITFTPPVDFQGAVRFEYTITDGFRTGTGYVYIAVYPPLEAKDLLFRVGANEPITIQEEEFLTNNSGTADPPEFDGKPLI